MNIFEFVNRCFKDKQQQTIHELRRSSSYWINTNLGHRVCNKLPLWRSGFRNQTNLGRQTLQRKSIFGWLNSIDADLNWCYNPVTAAGKWFDWWFAGHTYWLARIEDRARSLFQSTNQRRFIVIGFTYRYHKSLFISSIQIWWHSNLLLSANWCHLESHYS